MRWRFELAERLGMTVAELGERMSARELSQWMALERLRVQEQEKWQREQERKRRR